jgi:hypothetical protein
MRTSVHAGGGRRPERAPKAGVPSFEGSEHIELELDDLFVDDIPAAAVERAAETERVGSGRRIWAIVGLLVGLGSLGVAALLLRPSFRHGHLRLRFR